MSFLRSSRHVLAKTVTRTLMALSLVAVAGACSSETDTTDAAGAEPAADGSYSVGVLVMVQAQLLDDIVAAFEEAVTAGLGDATVEFDVQNANGDQSLITSIARGFAGSDHDAFAVAGTPAVIALAEQITDRPVFALAMGDPVGAGVAESLEAPGGNVTGSIDYVDPAEILERLTTIHPDLASIGTVYDPSNQNLQVWMEDLRAAADEQGGLEVVEATVSGAADVAQASRSLSGRADAILIGPDATVVAGIDAVAAVAQGDGIGLYVVGGDPSIDGVLASMGPDYPVLGTTAGENAAEILLGADPATTPFTGPDGVEVVVNEVTADALGITVPDSVLSPDAP